MKIICPICKKTISWEGNPYRPFCSRRCKLLDLGAWADEEYKIEGDSPDDFAQDSNFKPKDVKK